MLNRPNVEISLPTNRCNSNCCNICTRHAVIRMRLHAYPWEISFLRRWAVCMPLLLFQRFATSNSCFTIVPYKFRLRLLRFSHYVVKRNTLKNRGDFFLCMHRTQVYRPWALWSILNCFLNAISRFHTLATLAKVSFNYLFCFFLLQLALLFNPYN